MQGNELKRWRTEKGLTQEIAAFVLGVSVNTLRRWELKANDKKQTSKSAEIIVILIDRYKTALAELLPPKEI